jgi:transglutaminase-like putative cysteine protease
MGALPSIAAALLAAGAPAGDLAHRSSSYDVQQMIETVAVASPYKMTTSARDGTIRYRIALADGETLDWPETAEQHVESTPDAEIVTVCRDCGDEPAPTPEQLRAYLAPNRWVDNADPRIRAFARMAGGGRLDFRMERLVLAVQKRMTGSIDFDEYKTAREAYLSRSGDCTEFAVLLAAAARAAGIPVRVVGGMAYPSHFIRRSHAFAPHMWVQAWDGHRWVSYDAGLGRFDAGHIALMIGDGRPDSMRGMLHAMSKMRIVDAVSVIDVDAAQQH